MKYNLKSVEELSDKSVKEQVIEQHGGVVEFTFEELEKSIATFEKLMREIKPVIEHEKAKMENIEHYHPFVKEMSEQDLSTAYLYHQAKVTAKVHEDKLKEIEEAYNEEKETVEEIKKQIPELNEQETQ